MVARDFFNAESAEVAEISGEHLTTNPALSVFPRRRVEKQNEDAKCLSTDAAD